MVSSREVIFLVDSHNVKTGGFNALEEIVAVKLHAFSVRTGSHRVQVQLCGLSLSLGPIHLFFLATPLCPSPFFQLHIHLPLATQQPSVVPHHS